MSQLTRRQIRRLFEQLNDELRRSETSGELYLVGGAVMCLALRIGEEFHDEEDVRYLLRYLNIGSYEQALEIITRFYPAERFPQKALYALAELLPGRA